MSKTFKEMMKDVPLSERMQAQVDCGREVLPISVLTNWIPVAKKIEAERDALVRAWYECPADSVPEILDNVFQDIEFKYRDVTPWPPERK